LPNGSNFTAASFWQGRHVGSVHPTPHHGFGTDVHTETFQMPNFSFVLLYVENPPASAGFLFRSARPPIVESSPTFAMLPLSESVMLGLWSRNAVEPAAAASPGASEIAFTVDDTAAVEATFANWKNRGLTILQEPVQMDFGTTFVASDPDGHRLRVFVPATA
jgi:predicted enzyme related to lactoylglutathione lyase